MAKFKQPLMLMLAAGMLCLSNGSPDDFRINQLGYYPAANKIIPIINTNDSEFVIVDTAGIIVYQNKLSERKIWVAALDTVKQADFSAFKNEGTFWIKVSDKGVSPPIRISSSVLYDVSLASLKTFYYQRCSMGLDAQYAGKFAREAGHPDTSCLFHVSTGKTTDALPAKSPGGWYDAGDYGKYIVNAGISVGTMLSFYEHFGSYFGDSELNIPESENGIDDLLDETKYEIDWMITMQDTDGGVFHKLTTLQHAPLTSLPNQDLEKRYFIGKSTAATLDFAASMAMAGRIYGKIESKKEFSDSCISKAQRAWDWAVAHPTEFFRANPPEVGTGAYDDTLLTSDEFIWAASELFITTGDVKYKDSVVINSLSYNWPTDWKSIGRLAPLSLATVPNNLDSASVLAIRDEIKAQADSYLSSIKSQAFRIPGSNYFYWGSNSVFTNAGLFLVAAYIITSDTSYIKGAAEIADYLLGKNAVNISFVTGYGMTRPENIHYRPSISDTVKDPVPGFLVGGPNGSPKTYSDASGDYTTNEVAINWNAPSLALFAAINKILGTNKHTPDNGEYYFASAAEGPGTLEISPLKALYHTGDIITLTAKPDSGQMFLGWAGAASGITPQITLVISRDTKIVAKFGKPKELVVNGTFLKAAGWNTTLNETGVATASVINGEYKVSITNGGTLDWHIQVVQNGIPLFQNATYVFSFDARADSNRTIAADMAKSVPDYSSYMGTQHRLVNLTTQKQTFTYTFIMKKPTDLSARIAFNCGLSTSTIYLDNVSVKMLDISPVKKSIIHSKKNIHPVQIRSNGKSVFLQLSVADPQKAWLKFFNAQGKLIKNFTPSIRSLKIGSNYLSIKNEYTGGIYIARYFDGRQFFTSTWTNIAR